MPLKLLLSEFAVNISELEQCFLFQYESSKAETRLCHIASLDSFQRTWNFVEKFSDSAAKTGHTYRWVCSHADRMEIVL
jgi:pterin-4a-carbinolamine dehydratase